MSLGVSKYHSTLLGVRDTSIDMRPFVIDRCRRRFIETIQKQIDATDSGDHHRDGRHVTDGRNNTDSRDLTDSRDGGNGRDLTDSIDGGDGRDLTDPIDDGYNVGHDDDIIIV